MIDTETEADRPAVSTQADVTLVARGITVTASVDRSDEAGIIVRPVSMGQKWDDVIKPGDPVEIYWVGDLEERKLPARVASVDHSAEARWLLSPTGPAERSQRRKAVRGKVEVPVAMPWAGGALKGATIDLSEGGMRALVDGWGLPPDPRAPLDVSISLGEDLTLTVRGEVVWTSVRGTQQWVLAVRFTGLAERDEDLLRRRVFQALREERARELD
jgi:hypothetical protein